PPCSLAPPSGFCPFSEKQNGKKKTSRCADGQNRFFPVCRGLLRRLLCLPHLACELFQSGELHLAVHKTRILRKCHHKCLLLFVQAGSMQILRHQLLPCLPQSDSGLRTDPGCDPVQAVSQRSLQTSAHPEQSVGQGGTAVPHLASQHDEGSFQKLQLFRPSLQIPPDTPPVAVAAGN